MFKISSNAVILSVVLFYVILGILFVNTANAGIVKLTTLNTINLSGPINADNVLDVKKQLYKLHGIRNGRNYPLYLVIDSPGGSIYAGNSFIEMLNTIPKVNTVTIFAASMASAIVQQGKGYRYALSNGIMMFHRAKGQFSGQFNDGEVESQLKLWTKIVSEMEQKNANRMKISLAKYKSLVRDEYWITASEMKSKGVIDGLVKVTCSKLLVERVITKKIQTIFGPFETNVSACPHLR